MIFLSVKLNIFLLLFRHRNVCSLLARNSI